MILLKSRVESGGGWHRVVEIGTKAKPAPCLRSKAVDDDDDEESKHN